MIVNINLLPTREGKSKANLLTIILSLLILIIGSASFIVLTNKATNSTAIIQSQIDQTTAVINQLRSEQSKNLVNQAQNGIEEQRAVIEQTVLTSKLIKDSLNGLTGGAELTNFQYEQNTVTISIIVPTEREAGVYVQKIQKLKWVDDAKMVSLIKQESNNYLVSYLIDINQLNVPKMKGVDK
ncbi:hypothetical protein CN692_23210 [Bacillus sp. AFS002410]|uniref:hypothetical protein n=1 Tax=Bacillus sp. AFS002410 TaxID=2033481 RepID=UPI000BF1E428|nr:hypothetical protein [Bacillus sp. AFS002410]PEJ49357.1 hypothetical protein CN692_23210 [Bacillus sp. AFS002410]